MSHRLQAQQPVCFAALDGSLCQFSQRD